MDVKTLSPETRHVTTALPRKPGGANAISPFWLISFPILLLALFPLYVSRVGDSRVLSSTFWAASAALLVFLLILRRQVARSGRSLYYEVVLNKVHYVQLTMHICVFGYWGWYWPEVYRYAPLIAGQLVFVYALDMLVCWSRRDKWILGFGPFPIVLSTNLFLWFRDDWFYLQFLLLSVGVLGKEFLKWKREGRLVHIFNPSALSLFLFSVVLIATKSTGMTWGIEIADTFHRPPHIYLEIFVLGLIVQALFQVTLVTLFSAASLVALNILYTGITGDYNFIDSNIPVAVFLGLHLLVTDPATSPRKSFGKIVFGCMYGAGVFGMYRLLAFIGAPEFYDKLLCVPFLNLTVRALDHASDVLAVRFRSLVRVPAWSMRQANFAWMAVWVLLFVTMEGTGFLAKGRDHPGGDPEHWHQACLQGNGKACETWVRTLNVDCQDNSSAACLTMGQVLNEGQLITRNAASAGVALGHGCDLGASEACTKLIEFVQSDGKDAFQQACNRGDGASCFVLGSLYSGGSGVPKDDGLAFTLFHKSCDLEWWRGCGRLGVSYLVGQGTAVNPLKAIQNFEIACQQRNAPSCFEAGKLHFQGNPGLHNLKLARERFKQACELGIKAACE
jgi:hypothetical protein